MEQQLKGLGNKTPVAPVRSGDEQWLLAPMVELATRLHDERILPWLHLGTVARCAIALGKKAKLDMQSMLALQCAALLHDLGNIAVPYELLAKSTKLSRDEWYMITKHAMASSMLLKAQGMPEILVSIVQSHHEWFNGKGYPLGLAGRQIPLASRILSIADAFDAMNSTRPYRAALSRNEMVEEFKRGSGTQFDPDLVSILLPLLDDDLLIVMRRRVLHVITDDETLYAQLWFAAYPYGWELDNWPPAADINGVPASKLDKVASRRADLTVVDGRSTSGFKPLDPNRPVLWIDPRGTEAPAIHLPLDLPQLLRHLNTGIGMSSTETPRVMPIKVLIADPYSLFRQALKSYFDGSLEIVVVAEARSPAEYRKASIELDYDVAIVASDLLVGTHSTAPLMADDYHLAEEEATDTGKRKAMIVLVADEDLGRVMGGRSGRRTSGRFEPLYVPRSEASEVLIESVQKSYRAAKGTEEKS